MAMHLDDKFHLDKRLNVMVDSDLTDSFYFYVDR